MKEGQMQRSTEPPKDDLLTTDEVAKILNIAPGSIINMRWRRTGLPYIKVGASVRYRKSAVEAFIEKNTHSVVDAEVTLVSFLVKLKFMKSLLKFLGPIVMSSSTFRMANLYFLEKFQAWDSDVNFPPIDRKNSLVIGPTFLLICQSISFFRRTIKKGLSGSRFRSSHSQKVSSDFLKPVLK
jgi:excisionase family DNA binding protein